MPPRPDPRPLGLGAAWERDDGANIGLGIVSLTFPVFERGQGLRAEASARERRVSGELQAGRTIVAAEVRAALAVYRHRAAAAEELETNALPLLDQNEAQTRRSYESGQIALADLLAVRREIIGTRHEYLGYLLEAANAGIELESSAGILQ
ncbi:MAG: TolC family protein [Deltaproteobacteria bacterium]|nr:TolC family protein [Deltaproteobacteria bacterium]